MIPNDSFEYLWLSSSNAQTLKNEMRELALAAYGSLSNKLNAEGADNMQHAISKEETWEILLTNSHCLLCMSGECIIGMAFLIPSGNPWLFFESGWSYIRMLGVLPMYERQGIGRRLTQMCIDLAIQLNEKIIALHTSEFQEAARHIYESLGFTILKELEPQWGKQYWVYTLKLA